MFESFKRRKPKELHLIVESQGGTICDVRGFKQEGDAENYQNMIVDALTSDEFRAEAITQGDDDNYSVMHYLLPVN